MKEQSLELEDDYRRRLTPLEKNTYKSRFLDEEFSWEQINKHLFQSSAPGKPERIKDMRFGDAGKYFMAESTRAFCGFLMINEIGGKRFL